MSMKFTPYPAVADPVLQVDHGTVNSGTVILDISESVFHKLTVGGNLTIAIEGWPPSGCPAEVSLELENGGAHTITWPTVNWIKSDGTYSSTFSSLGITLLSVGTNFLRFWSTRGGSPIWGIVQTTA